MSVSRAQFNIGQVVQHKHYGFRGVVFDVDFEYSLDEHWYLEACKAMAGLGQPPIEKKQPFYHLLTDELNLTALWQQLSLDYNVELGVCIAAALQSGIVDPQESTRYELGGENLAAQFILVGLGQLAAASVECDRLVSFGG